MITQTHLSLKVWICLTILLVISKQQVLAETELSIEERLFSEYQNDTRDSLIRNFSFSDKVKASILKKDTVQTIKQLILDANLYGKSKEFKKCYTSLWYGVYLSELSKDEKSLARLLIGLGWLLLDFEHYDESIHIFKKALEIQKKFESPSQKDLNKVYINYYSIASVYNEIESAELATTYLDSAESISTKIKEFSYGYFLKVERGRVLKSIGKINQAEIIFKDTQNNVATKNPAYYSMIDFYLADIYVKKGKWNEAKEKYLNVLSNADNLILHENFIIKSCQNIAKVYAKKGDYKQSYQYLNKAESLRKQYFGIFSGQPSLSHINKVFRKDMLILNLEKRNQEVLILKEQLEVKNFVFALLLSITALVIIIFGMIYIFLNFKRKSDINLLTKIKELEKSKMTIAMKSSSSKTNNSLD